jgi:predicted Kef-type K+ transport protein
MSDICLLTLAIILLLVGILFITHTRRNSLNPSVGFLSAGILIVHNAFALIEENLIMHLVEPGVVFLLIDIGLIKKQHIKKA